MDLDLKTTKILFRMHDGPQYDGPKRGGAAVRSEQWTGSRTLVRDKIESE
jgi:hypothetical protein